MFSLDPAERELARQGRLGRPGDQAVAGRLVRAEVVRRLLTGLPVLEGEPPACLAAGLRIFGATLRGELDLSHAVRCDGNRLPPLLLEGCVVAEGIDLTGVAIGALSLAGSTFPFLEAPGLRCEELVDLSGVGSAPASDVCTVQLQRSDLRGGLRASDARLCTSAPRPDAEEHARRGGRRYALDLTEAVLGGSLMLQPGFKAFGGVSLAQARIDGDLWCAGAHLAAGEGAALFGQHMVVRGALSLTGDERPGGVSAHFRAVGEINLRRVLLRGLWVDTAELPDASEEQPPWRVEPEGEAAASGEAPAASGVGPVSLEGSTIDSLTFANSHLDHLDLRYVKIKTLHLSKCRIRRIEMLDAKVDGSFRIMDAEVDIVLLPLAAVEAAFEVSRARIDFLSLTEAVVNGAVAIRRSTIGRLDLTGSEMGSLHFEELEMPGGERAAKDRTRLWLKDVQASGEFTVRKLQIRSERDERVEQAMESIFSMRRRKLSCYPGWSVVEALTKVSPGDGDDEEGKAESEQVALLSFLWRSPDSQSWIREGEALLLDGTSFPFHALNRAEPPRLRNRFQAKEYLVLFASYIWAPLQPTGGPRAPFRIVRKKDLERFGIGYKLLPGKQFQPLRMAADTGPTPQIRCTVLFHDILFSALLTVPLSGTVRMEEDERIGWIVPSLEERCERPFRISEEGPRTPLPGMLPAGVMLGGRFRSFGWWGDWKQVDRRRDRERMVAALRSAIPPPPWVDLSDARVARLDDVDGLAWGERVRIGMDGFRYERTPRPSFERIVDEVQTRSARSDRAASKAVGQRLGNAWRTMLGQPPLGAVPVGTGVGRYRYRHRERWLNLQFKFGRQNGHEYRPHPYETLANALRNEGATKEARRILSQKLTIERRIKTPWYLRPFSWLFWAGFDYGLSTTRAATTVLVFALLGWAGTWYANREELLVIDFTPAATAVGAGGPDDVPLPGHRRPGILSAAAVTADIPCGDEILEPVYALDLMVPIIDLGQESRCRVRSTAPDRRWLHHPWIWELLQSLYKIGGAIVLSIALLTFSGVLRRHAES